MGYAIAWERRRALLSVLVPVLVPASLVLLALRLLAAPQDAAVINGRLVTAAPDGFVGFVDVTVSVLAWLLAITAGILAISRRSMRTMEIFKKAASTLFFQAFWVVAVIAVSLPVLWVASQVSLLGLAIIMVYAFVLARLSLVLPSMALDGQGSWALAAGRTLSTALRIILGVVVVPLLVLSGADRVGAWLLELMPHTAIAFLVKALGTLLLIAVVATQASTFAAVYLRLTETEAEPSTVEQGWRLAAALVLVPALAAAAIALSRGPQVVVHQGVWDGGAVEIVVVDGLPPVIFTEHGYYRCDDNTCHTGEPHIGDIAAREHTAVGMDGAGALLAVDFSRQGSDRLQVTRCAPACEHDGGTVIVLEDAALRPLPRFDVAGGKDGTIWLALAQQKTDAARIELSLIRCGGRNCNESRRIVAGTVDGELDAGDWHDAVSVHLRLDGQGRAIADFDLGWGFVHTAACDTAACDSASLTRREDPSILPRQAVGHMTAMVVNERGIFAVTAEPAAQPEQGFYVRIGVPAPAYERLVLWHCTDAGCKDRRRYPLHVRQRPAVAAFSGIIPFVSPIPNSAPNVHLAVLPDGTVLIAERETIISLRV